MELVNPLLLAIIVIPPVIGVVSAVFLYQGNRRWLLLLPPVGLLVTIAIVLVGITTNTAALNLGLITGGLSAVAFVLAYVKVRRVSLLLLAAMSLVWLPGTLGLFTAQYQPLGFLAFVSLILAVLGLIFALRKPSVRTVAPTVEPGSRRLNVYAVLSLIFALAIAPIGVVLGHIALGEVRRTGDRGRGLAIAGLVVGYAWTAGIILIFVLIFVAATLNH